MVKQEVKIKERRVLLGVEIRELIESFEELLGLMCNVIKISFGFEAVKILLIINFKIMIVLGNECSDFLTNPLKFVDADTEAMHFLQDFGELLVFVEEHLLDLF